eukprot:4456164-Prymnesium_polylepis.1
MERDEEKARMSLFYAQNQDVESTLESLRERHKQQELDLETLRAWHVSHQYMWYMNLIIPPDSNLKSKWDVFIIVLVLVSLFLVPIQLTYKLESDFWTAFQFGSDGIFAVDIFLSFVTAYEYENITVRQPRRIAKRYLKGWFTIDLLSTLPIDQFVDASGALGDSDQNQQALRLNRLIRLTRMFKLMRMMRLYRLTKGHHSGAWAIIREAFQPSTIRFFIFMFFAVAVLNLVGCTYWLVIDFEWEEARLAIDHALEASDVQALHRAQHKVDRLLESQWFPPDYVQEAAGYTILPPWVLVENITQLDALPEQSDTMDDVGTVFV